MFVNALTDEVLKFYYAAVAVRRDEQLLLTAM